MGKMLAEGLLRAGSVSGDQLKVFTRTHSKSKSFQDIYPDITICDSVEGAVRDTDTLLLCVPPNESIRVLEEVRKYFTEEQLLVSIVGSLTLDLIGRILPCKAIRMVPSITSEVDEGIFIISGNSRCTKEDTDRTCGLFRHLGDSYEVPEDRIEAFTDLTSCSPGIFSAVYREFIAAAVKIGKIPEKLAEKMFTKTLYGLAKFYSEGHGDFATVMKRVARKGGTTEIGIGIVRRDIPGCFDQVFLKTIEHQDKRKHEMTEAYVHRDRYSQ